MLANAISEGKIGSDFLRKSEWGELFQGEVERRNVNGKALNIVELRLRKEN